MTLLKTFTTRTFEGAAALQESVQRSFLHKDRILYATSGSLAALTALTARKGPAKIQAVLPLVGATALLPTVFRSAKLGLGSKLLLSAGVVCGGVAETRRYLSATPTAEAAATEAPTALEYVLEDAAILEPLFYHLVLLAAGAKRNPADETIRSSINLVAILAALVRSRDLKTVLSLSAPIGALGLFAVAANRAQDRALVKSTASQGISHAGNMLYGIELLKLGAGSAFKAGTKRSREFAAALIFGRMVALLLLVDGLTN
ncbi:hypothetical protein [Corynebacterium caspium]|uniref:hypothetical protein n=1 Tax=Corynebacterium caspium TaxID=234828 RepID=UPI00037FBA8C|nr:hypothetical protein [Corynebacterium caspium]WKD58587.1 hypothetical protein CCASP_00795 [Corynebacterium caspium DSM 44850]